MIEISTPVLYSFYMIGVSLIAAFVDVRLEKEGLLTRNWKRFKFYLKLVAGILLAYNLKDNVALIAPFLLNLMFAYWIQFELILNSLRGRYMFYIGKSSDLDNLVRRIYTKDGVYDSAKATAMFFWFKVVGWLTTVIIYEYLK